MPKANLKPWKAWAVVDATHKYPPLVRVSRKKARSVYKALQTIDRPYGKWRVIRVKVVPE